MSRMKWNGRTRKIPIGSRVCVARVLILMKQVEKQLRALTPRFRWPAGDELFAAIVADGDSDVVVGYALARELCAHKVVAEDLAVREKLLEAAKQPRRREAHPFGRERRP